MARKFLEILVFWSVSIFYYSSKHSHRDDSRFLEERQRSLQFLYSLYLWYRKMMTLFLERGRKTSIACGFDKAEVRFLEFGLPIVALDDKEALLSTTHEINVHFRWMETRTETSTVCSPALRSSQNRIYWPSRPTEMEWLKLCRIRD